MYSKSLIAVGALLLSGALNIGASPLESKLVRRVPPKALDQNATKHALRWQPSLDFDKNGCYNTPAVDAEGNIAPGLDHNNTGASENCRIAADLDNNNVYVRHHCGGNGWCAYLYAYYFEKDVAVEQVADAGGHRHDWEHIAVFVQNDQLKYVSVSQHKSYNRKAAGTFPMDGEHPKSVYHKDGGLTHCFRFAKPDNGDEPPENARGQWIRGALVQWGSMDANVRSKLANADFGHAVLGLKDENFYGALANAKPDEVDW